MVTIFTPYLTMTVLRGYYGALMLVYLHYVVLHIYILYILYHSSIILLISILFIYFNYSMVVIFLIYSLLLHVFSKACLKKKKKKIQIHCWFVTVPFLT